MTVSDWIPELVQDCSSAVGAVSIWSGSDLLSRGSTFAIIPLDGDGFDRSSSSVLATNAHVVEGENVEVRVRFPGGLDVPADVRLVDKATDVAFLQVPVACTRPFPLRMSDDVRLGESVIAIGNPHGFECSVSAGIISGRDRILTGSGTGPGAVYANLLQTDTPINGGNSGGPLIGRDGHVVGMNSISRTNTDGLHFAVPADTVASHYEELVTYGESSIKRASIGGRIASYEFDPPAQHALGLRSGARIEAVREESPMAAAGLQVGDVVIEFRELEVEHRHDLMMRLNRAAIGATCQLKYVREEQIHETQITPDPRND